MAQDPIQIPDLVLRRIRQDVQSMQAYAIQASHGMTKLDAMENPHRLPLELQAELGQRLGAVALNRYPDTHVADLRTALADYVHLPTGYDLMLGNGSDELIALLAMACDVEPNPTTGAKAVILAPVPGFVMYAMSAQLQGLDFVGVPLRSDFELDTPAMLEAIAKHRPAIIYLAYPNNPTANLWDAQAMSVVVAAAAQVGSLVVIDEAYQPFSSRTYLEKITAEPEQHAHVLLLRTLSKFGLAGVRIGYLVGPSQLVREIDKVRPPYNISVLNAECALFALEHAAVFAQQATDIMVERARLQMAFAGMKGLRAYPSDANMILVRFEGGKGRAQTVFESLKTRRVLLKNVSKMHSLLFNCLRITVGNAAENTQLLAALEEIL
jgi:histidinol-phosphate aminotransferase